MNLTIQPVLRPVTQRIQKKSVNSQHVYVHPCVINKQACLVYPRGLPQQLPALYDKLKQHFHAKGYFLKEDQRSENNKNTHKFERRRWMPVLLFTASMLFENIALADNVQQNVELRLMENNHLQLISQQQSGITTKSKQNNQLFQSHRAVDLYKILDKHYVKQKTDPHYIQGDLKEMANYYSYFPEVISLITSLKKKNWTLSYNENTWSTVATGGMLQVNTATIHFNTRSAAKLKLHNSCTNNPVCIASPSDALLHELLHTHSMLIKTDEFIRQGGMNTQRYPYQHEYLIIKQERELYASMSKRDTHKRPQRNEHTGRKIIASCATCIK